jgi:hypothetical protein
MIILAEFGISGESASDFNLHEIDGLFGGLDNKAVSKRRWENMISDGDTVVLKSIKEATLDELITVYINLTTTGQPDDCIPMGEIKISKEARLKDLREAIINMETFAGNDVLEECIRLRMKSSVNITSNKMDQRIMESKIRNGEYEDPAENSKGQKFFGKILRETQGQHGSLNIR